jgi:uncharacterized protein
MNCLPIIPQIQVSLDCNLACIYCFENHRRGIIGLDVVETILRKTIEHNSRAGALDGPVLVYWHGGEPLMAGAAFFETVLEIESRFPGVTFQNRVQTNGTMMTDRMAQLLARNQFQVGFSVDGPEDLHNYHRRFRLSNKGSFAAVIQGIETYRRHSRDDQIAVIAVVTQETLDRVKEFYQFFNDLKANVQLDIYDLRACDAQPGTPPTAASTLLAPSPFQVGEFLIALFDRWFNADNGHVNFNELHHEVKMALQPDLEFGDPYDKKRCDFRRLIFSPTGKVFSCDQYINDDSTAVGDIRKDSLTDILARKARQWEMIKRHIRQSSDHMACGSCHWGRQCGGGCLTCMKYNACLTIARRQGLPHDRWHEMELPAELTQMRGETYYCDGLRTFRRHVRQAVKAALNDN